MPQLVETQGSFVVYTNASRFEVLPPSAQAILGEYVEEGFNHGRKVYKRRQTDAQKGLPSAVLFYWDARDGKELSGWWFGDKVGGGQVWARNLSTDLIPPKQDWKCPVDGPPQKHLLCEARRVAKEGRDDQEPEPPWAAKRSHGSGPQPPASKRGRTRQVLVLSSKLGDDATTEVKALLGEYVEQHMNHGKKTFQRSEEDGRPGIWLYYWDARDGKEQSGWWFSQEVGGSEVLGCSQQHTALPPITGWHIPHDEAVKGDITLRPKKFDEESKMSDQERVDKVQESLVTLEVEARKALATGESVLSNDGDVLEEAVRAVVQMLDARVRDIRNARDSIARHKRALGTEASGTEIEAELSLADEKFEAILGRVQGGFERAQARLEKLEKEDAEERDGKRLEEALAVAMELVAKVEKEVEVAATEDAAAQARSLLDAARRKVTSTLDAARTFAPEAKKVAMKEFSALAEKVSAAEQLLGFWEAGAQDVEEDTAMQLAPMGEDADIAIFELDDSSMQKEGDVSARVVDVETNATEALKSARLVLKDEGDDKGRKLCFKLLKEHLVNAKRAQKSVAEEISLMEKKQASTQAIENIKALGPRMKVVQSHIERELAAVARQAASARKEERQMKAVEMGFSAALDAVMEAEEAVETVLAEAGDLEWRQAQVGAAPQSGNEYGDDIEKALEAAQACADKAVGAISQASGRLDAQLRVAQKLPPEQQEATCVELTQARKRLAEAEGKLGPYKRVRSEFDQQLKAKADLEDATGKVAAIEGDIEKMTSALPEKEATELIQPLQARLNKLLQQLQSRSASSEGALGKGFVSIQERAIVAREKMGQLHAKAQGQRQQAMAQTVLDKAQQESKKAEAWLAKIAEAEAPWAKGVEIVPEEKATPALAACEQLATKAEPEVLAAKAQLAEALLRARQLPDGTVRPRAIADVQQMQTRVDAVALKVMQLKTDTFARRTKMQMTDVVAAVAKAEVEAQKVSKAGAVLGEDNLERLAAAKLKEATASIMKSEAAASKACAQAQEAIQKKRQDPRDRSSPSFHTQLSKLHDRLQTAQAALAGQVRVAKEADGNLQRFKSQRAGLAKMDSLVSEIEILTLPLGDERPSDKADDSKALTVMEAQETLSKWRSEAAALGENPHGAMKLAMGRLLEQCNALQKRLDAAKEPIRQDLDRVRCRGLVQEAAEKIQKANEAMAKCEQAEGPYLTTGLDVLPPDLSAATIAACEAAATVAWEAISAARSFAQARTEEVVTLVRSNLDLKQSAEGLREALQQAQALQQKLGQYKRDAASRKRAAGVAAKARTAG